MGTARKYPVLDWVKPSFEIFDIWANDGLNRSGTGCFTAVLVWQQWASKVNNNNNHNNNSDLATSRKEAKYADLH